MSKQAIPSEIAVGSIVVSHPVFDELVEVLQQLNWSHRERVCEVLVVDDQADALAGAGFVERRRMMLWIDPDAVELEVLVVATVPAANTVTIRTTIGADALDIVLTNAESGAPQTDVLLTADTGTGWQIVTLEIEHTTGAGTCTRDLWQVQVVPVEPNDAPDPEV